MFNLWKTSRLFFFLVIFVSSFLLLFFSTSHDSECDRQGLARSEKKLHMVEFNFHKDITEPSINVTSTTV